MISDSDSVLISDSDSVLISDSESILISIPIPIRFWFPIPTPIRFWFPIPTTIILYGIPFPSLRLQMSGYDAKVTRPDFDLPFVPEGFTWLKMSGFISN